MVVEIWKDIEGYTNLFQVSNFGNVKSLGGGRSWKKERHINQTYSNGYKRVTIHKGVGKKSFLVHRLVAQTFIPNSENKLEVNHIDGNKLNNQVSNLEWCTHSENIRHSIKIGLKKSGGNHIHSKRINQYDMNGNFINSFGSIKEASRILNLNAGNVSRCSNGLANSVKGFKFSVC